MRKDKRKASLILVSSIIVHCRLYGTYRVEENHTSKMEPWGCAQQVYYLSFGHTWSYSLIGPNINPRSSSLNAGCQEDENRHLQAHDRLQFTSKLVLFDAWPRRPVWLKCQERIEG